MIESYSFGEIVIDGKKYTKDVIILPMGEVICPWWRRAGHLLDIGDLNEILFEKPDYLIIGTGSPGLMEPVEGLIEKLENMGIKVSITPTAQAVEKYNVQRDSSRHVAACFHLTC